ncbi:glycosyltransferase family 2 protein [Dactylosporangium sp. NPDC049525]|uniref:glycosyltransferase family 2 protein n=1 Tax=Dactylosporangium sp. NPDC049525 TaxID=3154730 RepID=UPI003439B63B
MPLLSVIVPMYNEQDALPLLVERLRPALDAITESYEVVAVNDGSVDATGSILHLMRTTWPQLRVITFSRNCGHQAALTAGLHRAHGDYVISIDADLQDPPEKIAEMLTLARSEQLDVVYGVRNDRRTDTVTKRATAGMYYGLMRRMVGNRVPAHGGDFRLLSRRAVETLRSLPEQAPVYRLLIPWLGLPSGEVHYSREKRVAGSTKYPFGKMVRLAMDSITSFSALPLRLATWMGSLGFVLCILLSIATVIAFISGVTVPGWTSLSLAIMFIGAVQLLCLGLMGEYISRIYTTIQGRPAYFIGADTAMTGPAAEQNIPIPRLPGQLIR